MKYSFVITYYNRPSFYSTLVSFYHHYKDRHDYEILVLEDKKTVNDPPRHEELMGILGKFGELPIKCIPMSYDNKACPCSVMNHGVDIAEGQYIILTNPECFHTVDMLSGLDEEFSKDPNVYVVCSCVDRGMPNIVNNLSGFKFEYPSPNARWYQHSKYKNRLLNFCTAISRENYIKIGGFNEVYDVGSGRADVEFMKRVSSKFKIVCRDDLLIIHISHPKVFSDKASVTANAAARGFKSRFKDRML